MTKQKRKYNSKVRAEKSQAKRADILNTARILFSKNGIDQTTIDEIAKKASVSMPLVYAVFESKAGIVRQLGDRFVFGEDYKQLVKQSHSFKDARDSLKLAPKIASTIFAMEQKQLGFLWNEKAASLEVKDLLAKLETQRYERQAFIIERLQMQGYLSIELDIKSARDILWSLTGRDLYKKLVIEQRWIDEKYIELLVSILCKSLLQ